MKTSNLRKTGVILALPAVLAACGSSDSRSAAEANPAVSQYIHRGVELLGTAYKVDTSDGDVAALRSSTEITGDKDKDLKKRLGTISPYTGMLALCEVTGGSVGTGANANKWLLVAVLGKDFHKTSTDATGNETVVGYISEQLVSLKFPDITAPISAACTPDQEALVLDSLLAVGGFPPAPTTTTQS